VAGPRSYRRIRHPGQSPIPDRNLILGQRPTLDLIPILIRSDPVDPPDPNPGPDPDPVAPHDPQPNPTPADPDPALPVVDSSASDTYMIQEGHNSRGDHDTGEITVVAMLANSLEGDPKHPNHSEETVLEDAISSGLHQVGAEHQPVSGLPLVKELIGTQYQFTTTDIQASTSEVAAHLSSGDRVAVEVDRSVLHSGETGTSVVWVTGTASDDSSGHRPFR